MNARNVTICSRELSSSAYSNRSLGSGASRTSPSPPNGNIYILDSAFEHLFDDFVPAIYRIPAGSLELEALYAGVPLENPVGILITPE